MKSILMPTAACCLALCTIHAASAQQTRRPYHLSSVDLKRRVIWGAECRRPDGQGLAFGGQDQDADDGRPHTRVWVDGQWTTIDHQLRAGNPLQQFYQRIRYSSRTACYYDILSAW